MADNTQIINLYTELAENPHKDFGWDKGLENAKAHGYKQAWIDAIPDQVWDFCAAVGNPFSHADIKKGDTVLDLGCGAGVDVLVSSSLVGENGKVIGVDVTPKMVEVATKHVRLANRENVVILESSFDDIDIEDESVDIVISNGAINLTSCKESVFAEIYRVLKSNGKIYFADMIDVSIDEGSCCSVERNSRCENSDKEDWANCVAGTMRERELIELIQKAGFKDVECMGHTHYSTAKTTRGATFRASKTPADALREKHWDKIFQSADYTQVLWHQNSPKKSLELVRKYSDENCRVIDVGCGASYLVDYLLADGYENITLLDTSKTSLEIVKERVDGGCVTYVRSDVLNFNAEKKFDVWHDRAVFHFLLSKKEREKYFAILSDSLKSGAIAIISTFGVDGPIQCAGLDIVQYNHSSMSSELTDKLELMDSEEYLHITPKQSEQKYIYFILRKK